MTGTADRRGPEGDGWYEQQQYYYEPEQQPQAYQQQGYYQQPPVQQQPVQPEQYYQQQQPSYPQEQYYYEPEQQPQAYQQQGYYQQPPVQQQPVQPEQYYQQQGYYQQQSVQPVQPPTLQPPTVQPVQAPAQPAQAPAEPVRPRAVVPPRLRPAEPAAEPQPEEPSEQVGGRRSARPKGPDYGTGEFTFVDERTEDSEDAIDWLKFAESRSEVRAERRRRLRNRLIGAAVALALVGGGAGGYVWWTHRGNGAAAAAAGGRQVNVVHLRDPQGKVTTALLVNDAAGKKGTVLLLPDTLRLPGSGDTGTTTVGQAMDALGAYATRDGLGTVLGAKVAGTWRLDTPYLRLLVAQLGGVRVDTNAEVREDNKPDGKVVASPGKGVLLTGVAATAYATYQGPGETRDAQMARFGQVMEAIVRAMPTDLDTATEDVKRMNSVPDPSLPETALAGVLAQLSQLAKDGGLSTATLKTKPDGTLDEAVAGKQVKDILGGTLNSAAAASGNDVRVSIVNASGNDAAATAANTQVINAGLTALPSAGKANPQPNSEIRYADDAKAAAAKSLAVSLGLPETAAKKVADAQNSDLVLVLGKDYKVPETPKG